MAVIMRAGELRTRIQLQRAESTRDGIGGEVKTWSTYATVWAQFLGSTSREAYRARQMNAEVSHVIRIRYKADVRPTDRVLFGTRVLDIIGAEDEEQQHIATVLTCKEAR